MDGISEILNRGIEQLVGRSSGPLHLRLVIQPIVATIIAIKAGLRDARERRPPFLWTLVRHPGERRRLVKSGWEDIGKVFTVAIIMDTVYQLFVLRAFYIVQALSVAIIVAVVPYVILRGIVTRLARHTAGENSSSSRAA